MAERGNETHELVITRVLDAPPERVFALWASPEHLVRWWGPRDDAGRDFTTPSCEIDFRPGGQYRICIRSPRGRDLWQRGTYEEIVPPERLVFTFAWDNPGEPSPLTRIEVRFDAEGAQRTRMTFRQSGLPTAAERDSHRAGWQQFVERLAACVSEAAP
ncbi:MAG: SRPBCC domain-containing protein [Rhizobacter sp.]